MASPKHIVHSYHLKLAVFKNNLYPKISRTDKIYYFVQNTDVKQNINKGCLKIFYIGIKIQYIICYDGTHGDLQMDTVFVSI